MLYVADEATPTSTALVAAIQHALVVLMLVVYTVIVGQEIGLSEAELRGFVSLEIVVMGIATLLQGLRTRVSSGHVVVHNPSTVSMGAFVAVAATFGLGAVAGGILLSGIFIFLLARFLPRLQMIFPPEVTGVLLVLLGLALLGGGVTRFTGLENGVINGSHTLIAFATLAVIVGCSIWAPAKIKVFAVVAGAVCGLLMSVVTGQFGLPEIEAVGDQPIFAFPLGAYEIPTPELVIAAALPIFVIELISAIDSIGTGVAIDKINNEKWRRADMPMISRLISGHGLAVTLNGLTATLPVGTSSANLGLAHATGVGARVVAVMTGLILIACAFLPQVSTFISLIPAPVVGAIVIYTAGYMLAVGMELILSRMMNSRRMFMVGISISAGAAILLVPELTSQVPENLKPIFESSLTIGVGTAIILNLLFRIGISQSASIDLPGAHSGNRVTDFLEENGAIWGARRDVISKAGLAVSEALEALHSSELIQDNISLSASFDEYKVIADISYDGQKLVLAQEDQQIDLHALMEEDGDDALELAMANMSSVLIKNLADLVESSEEDGRSRLRLTFNH